MSATDATDDREVWQRGPVEGVPPLLQPVAHALLQVAEEVEKYSGDLPDKLLWRKPVGLASVGFHLLHIRGVIDRLFTYARGEALSSAQLTGLSLEKEIPAEPVSASRLVNQIRQQVDMAVKQLSGTPEASLTHARALGRRKIPTTVIGLLFHAAEHSQRHLGQLLVTAKVIRNTNTAP